MAERCVAVNRASAPAPGNVSGFAIFDVLNVFFWELNRAALSAKLRRTFEAEQALDNAVAWSQQYGLGNPDGLVPVMPMMDATRGYLAEQRGDTASALKFYQSAGKYGPHPDFARSRVALLHLLQNNPREAVNEAQAFLKTESDDPTALFVLGAVALRDNARPEAIKLLERAKASIDQHAGNSVVALRNFERDRIESALAEARR